jgi:hypothetical protein
MANIMLSVICAHVASRYRLENQASNSTAVSESISNEAAATAGNNLAAAIAERAQARKLSSHSLYATAAEEAEYTSPWCASALHNENHGSSSAVPSGKSSS